MYIRNRNFKGRRIQPGQNDLPSQVLCDRFDKSSGKYHILSVLIDKICSMFVSCS